MNILYAKWVDYFIEYVFFVYDDVHAVEKEIQESMNNMQNRSCNFLLLHWWEYEWARSGSTMSAVWIEIQKIKNETTAKYNAERRVFFAVAEALLQNDLQKYEWALHY